MKAYHCKLEEIGNWRMISVDLNVLRYNQKFWQRYWQFYKPINIEECCAWIHSGMSYL